MNTKQPEPRALAQLMLSAVGMTRATEKMDFADQAAMLCAGLVVWEAAYKAGQAAIHEVLVEYIAAADATVAGVDDVAAMLRFGKADEAARAAIKEPKE